MSPAHYNLCALIGLSTLLGKVKSPKRQPLFEICPQFAQRGSLNMI